MRLHVALAALAPALLTAPAFAQPAPGAPSASGSPGTSSSTGEQAPAPSEQGVQGATDETRATPPAGNLANDFRGHGVIEGDEFSDRLVLDTGRLEYRPPSPGRISLAFKGEYQLRYRAFSDLPLTAPISDPAARTLGQNHYLYHWLRIGTRFQYKDKLAIVAQIDVPRGLVIGDTTRYVGAAFDSFQELNAFEVHPRYLYVEYNSPIGLFRVGQQGQYWGMGILANDGDHPSLFGDYLRGSLSERILFATTPFGRNTPLVVALAGDLVFHDNTADLIEGDRAFQGILAVQYKTKPAEIGVYGVVRHQTRDREATGSLTPFVEELTVGVLDFSGRFEAPIPGARAFAYGQFEAAAIFGSTSFVRSAYNAPLDPTAPREDERVRSFGASAVLGAVHVAGQGKSIWGDLVGELEVGYASGDANPYDGVTKRFTFDPNHNVGLVLFDQVLAWKSARAATIAGDPQISARPAPGLQLLPTRGGVSGAQYLNPRFVIRPKRWLDLKGGAVIAQTTADLVDPYHAGALGNFANYEGGDPRRHDLGVELDAGADVRIAVERAATVQIGAEGGVLFPGRAFADAAGNVMPNQYLANLKLGLQF